MLPYALITPNEPVGVLYCRLSAVCQRTNCKALYVAVVAGEITM